MNGKPKTYFSNTTYLELFIPIIKYISIVRITKRHKNILNINTLFFDTFSCGSKYLRLYCETGIVLEYVLYVKEIIIRIRELLTVCVWFKDQKKLSFFFLIVYDIPIAYFTLQSIFIYIWHKSNKWYWANVVGWNIWHRFNKIPMTVYENPFQYYFVASINILVYSI